MAQAAQFYLEKMLPELDDLERKGIFTKEEIKTIAKKRKELEIEIHKRGPKKADYLNYIEYEVNLEQLRRKRKIRFGLNVAPEKGEKGISLSDFSILKRIHGLYQKALKKYHGDEDLWIQYFQWATDVGSSKTLGHMFARAIQLHPNNPSFFIMSGAWEYSQNGNIDSSRSIFQSGIRLNPSSENLWIEYYKMEILNIQKIKSRMALLIGNSDQKSSEFVSIPHVVYSNAITAIPKSSSLRIELFKLSKLFSDVFQNDYDFILTSYLDDFKENEKALMMLTKCFEEEE